MLAGYVVGALLTLATAASPSSAYGSSGQEPSGAEPDQCDGSVALNPGALGQIEEGELSEAARHRLLPDDNSARDISFEGLNIDVETVDPELGLLSKSDGFGYQLVAVSNSRQPLIELRLRHRFTCIDGADPSVVLAKDGQGGSVMVSDGRSERALLTIATPWALDADGKSLKTWYEADGSTLIQKVDASGAVGPITFDPLWSTLWCNYWSTTALAWDYLDMASPQEGWCPARDWLAARVDYWPIWAYEANVANDYGWVLVKEEGDCTLMPDTGLTYDFQVPCKAHDYCYDLRKAGFSGTVSDSDCDVLLYLLAEANCNDRSAIPAFDCRGKRDVMYVAVTAPGVVTDPDPPALKVQVVSNHKCMDLEGPSYSLYTPIQQWTCGSLANQRFKFVPAAGYPGFFNIQVLYSGQCVDTLGSLVRQFSCGSFETQRFYVEPSQYGDGWALKTWSPGAYYCVTVPNGSNLDGADLGHLSCSSGLGQNQIWTMSAPL